MRRKAKPGDGLFARLVSTTSRYSLSFYFMHYLLIGWTLCAVYMATGRYRISSLMGDVPSLACGLAAIVALEVLLFHWQKAGGKYSLEWFLEMVAAQIGKAPKQSSG